MCERRGGCPGLPDPNNTYGVCGRKATLNLNVSWRSVASPGDTFIICTDRFRLPFEVTLVEPKINK